METHQKCRLDLHFREPLGSVSHCRLDLFFFLSPSSLPLLLDHSRGCGSSELSPGHMVSFSISPSLWTCKTYRVAMDGYAGSALYKDR